VPDPAASPTRLPVLRELEGFGMAFKRDSGVAAALRGDFLALSATVVCISSLSLCSIPVAFCGLRSTTTSDFCCSSLTALGRTGEGFLLLAAEVVALGMFDLAGLLVTN